MAYDVDDDDDREEVCQDTSFTERRGRAKGGCCCVLLALLDLMVQRRGEGSVKRKEEIRSLCAVVGGGRGEG